MKLSEIALNVLKYRYLALKDNGELETPEDMVERTAIAVASAEMSKKKRMKLTDSFCEIIDNLDFLPNTPCLINAGRKLNQLSACFVLEPEDSIEGIFDCIKNAAIIHKSGGGTGFDFSSLRPNGSMVEETNGIASGPVSFMRVFDAATKELKQGGVRRGANMGVLRVDHPDIMEFIKAKNIEGQLENFNISVAITDEFMQCFRLANYKFPLRFNGKVVKEVDCMEILSAIVDGMYANGEPGILFIDTINRLNILNNIERINSCNPCGEQPLPNYGSCNLGSINLSNMVVKKQDKYEFDYTHFGKTIELGVHFLDNVISVSSFPLQEIEEEVRKTRRIGIGIMGLADAMLKLGIRYGSSESVDFTTNVMKFMDEIADHKSRALGVEKGIPQALHNIKMMRRNGCTTTVAPTGSLSLIAGCSSGCEPIFSFKYTKHALDSEFTVLHPIYKEYADKYGVDACIPDYFVTSEEVTMKEHADILVTVQKYVEAGVSKTINAPNSTTKNEIQDIIFYLYENGCKAISFYRKGSRDKEGQVDLSTPSTTRLEINTNPTSVVKERPKNLLGWTERVKTARGKLYLTVNELDGKPFEVFVKISKSGKDDFAYSEALGRIISVGLRAGVSVEDVIKHMKNISGDDIYYDNSMVIRSVPDAIAKVLEQKYITNCVVEQRTTVKQNEDRKIRLSICPECSNEVVYAEGCVECRFCGWSKCA